MVLKASSEKRKRTQVLPTPESPIRSSLKSRSYVFFAIGRSGSGARRRWPRGIGAAHYGQLLTQAFWGRSSGEACAGERAALDAERETFRTASSRKPRRWRRPCLRGAAPAAPQPLPAAPPGSGESVGTKWPPLPPQRGSAGTLPRASERALRRGSAAGLDTASARSRNSALRTRAAAAEEVSRADEPCYITQIGRAHV